METRPNQPKRLLVASAAAEVRAGVREALAALRCQMEEMSGAREVVEAAERERPDLLVADMVLRDATGIALCRFVREHPRLSRLPIVLLSAFKDEMDRVLAFEVGADDFLAMPYYGRELLSRVRAILRRTRGSSQSGPLQGPIRLDPDGARLEVFGEQLDLTPKEFRILSVLIRNDRRVLSRDRIIDEVWDRTITEPRVVDAHIKAIRRKLGPLADAIETVRGVGFRYTSPEGESGERGGEGSDAPPLARAGRSLPPFDGHSD